MQIQHNKITWTNLHNPQTHELGFLDELAIAPVVIRELLAYNKRPKIEEYNDYLFLVLHFPVFNPATRETAPTELDFVVTRDRVITIFQNPNPCLEQFFANVEKNENIKNKCFKSTGILLLYILNSLIDSCFPMLDHIHEKIENIEKNVFNGREKEMLKEIAIVKRDIIDFRRTMKPQRMILELLAKKTGRFFGQDLELPAQEIINTEVRVWNALENHKELIEAIEKTNEGLLSYHISRVMHILTFFSIILFSLTFIAGFFSMHVMRPVLASNDYGLWIAGGIMLADVILITVIFRMKRWM